ncbi:hypothetical protein QTG54_015798 [Skeletonema marinoi]|uniref:Uncharacterized protein n=1 Tax=Skeletonema marinoi TaxID=267567 RepID=A0AAD8XUA3_9STRA|nr:hypothetical protein QTG54_015798 [Skeletonema marinoi]
MAKGVKRKKSNTAGAAPAADARAIETEKDQTTADGINDVNAKNKKVVCIVYLMERNTCDDLDHAAQIILSEISSLKTKAKTKKLSTVYRRVEIKPCWTANLAHFRLLLHEVAYEEERNQEIYLIQPLQNASVKLTPNNIMDTITSFENSLYQGNLHFLVLHDAVESGSRPWKLTTFDDESLSLTISSLTEIACDGINNSDKIEEEDYQAAIEASLFTVNARQTQAAVEASLFTVNEADDDANEEKKPAPR